jgi:hypothetical protein
MAVRCAVTTVTTVTRKRHIPSLGVVQIVCAGGGTLSRNTAGGMPQKVVTTVTAVTGISRSPRLSSSGGCGEALCKGSEHDS